jgi:hypothetical protein
MRRELNFYILFTWISCFWVEVGNSILRHTTGVAYEPEYLLHSLTVVSYTINYLIKEKIPTVLEWTLFQHADGSNTKMRAFSVKKQYQYEIHILFPDQSEKFGWIPEFNAHLNSMCQLILRIWDLYFNCFNTELNVHSYSQKFKYLWLKCEGTWFYSFSRIYLCLVFAAAQHQVKKWKILSGIVGTFKKVQLTTYGECLTCCQHCFGGLNFPK